LKHLNRIKRAREDAEKMEPVAKWFEEGVFYQKKGHMNVITNPVEAEEAYTKASECFDKALEIDPDNYSAWYNKGICFQNMGKTQEAIRCYDESIKINPNFGRAIQSREILKMVKTKE
jgi:tetratricopeptide (TPR) repeat protein